jgi:hypothetical protein
MDFWVRNNGASSGTALAAATACRGQCFYQNSWTAYPTGQVATVDMSEEWWIKFDVRFAASASGHMNFVNTGRGRYPGIYSHGTMYGTCCTSTPGAPPNQNDPQWTDYGTVHTMEFKRIQNANGQYVNEHIVDGVVVATSTTTSQHGQRGSTDFNLHRDHTLPNAHVRNLDVCYGDCVRTTLAPPPAAPVCVPYSGACPNGNLLPQARRTGDNQCGSCNSGFTLQAPVAAVSTSDFSFAGNLCSGLGLCNSGSFDYAAAPLLTGDNTYGIYSTDHGDGSALFDGQASQWSSHAYRASGSNIGGMEIRFANPTLVEEVLADCIYQSTGDISTTCYGGGQYDFRSFNADYWDGSAWVEAYRYTNGDSNGPLTATMSARAQSKHWRFYIRGDQDAHVGNTRHIHFSEITITRARSSNGGGFRLVDSGAPDAAAGTPSGELFLMQSVASNDDCAAHCRGNPTAPSSCTGRAPPPTRAPATASRREP